MDAIFIIGIPAKWELMNKKEVSPKEKDTATPPLLFSTFPKPVATSPDCTSIWTMIDRNRLFRVGFIHMKTDLLDTRGTSCFLINTPICRAPKLWLLNRWYCSPIVWINLSSHLLRSVIIRKIQIGEIIRYIYWGYEYSECCTFHPWTYFRCFPGTTIDFVIDLSHSWVPMA